MLIQDELASALVGTLQHTGLQGSCPFTARDLGGALPSQDLGCLGKSRAGAALDALPGPRRGIVAGSKPQGTSRLRLSPEGAA